MVTALDYSLQQLVALYILSVTISSVSQVESSTSFGFRVSYFYFLFLFLFSLFFFAVDNMTGFQSLYTIYEGHEIMFHVSTLLPFTPDNPQQVSNSLEFS